MATIWLVVPEMRDGAAKGNGLKIESCDASFFWVDDPSDIVHL